MSAINTNADANAPRSSQEKTLPVKPVVLDRHESHKFHAEGKLAEGLTASTTTDDVEDHVLSSAHVLEYCVRFERLVSTISTQLLQAKEGLSQNIQITLQQIGQFAGAERSYVLIGDRDTQTLSQGYGWQQQTGALSSDIINQLFEQLSRYWPASAQSGIINHSERAPGGITDAIQQFCGHWQTTALLLVPIQSDSQWVGWIGIDGHQPDQVWPPDMTTLLQVTGEMLVSALEHQRHQAYIQQRQREFQALAANSPDMIVRFDRQQHFTYINPMVQTLTGISLDQCLGKGCDQVDLPDALGTTWQTMAQAVIETGQAQTQEFGLDTGDGWQCFQAYFVAEAGSDNQTIDFVVGVTRNITRQKQLQSELETSQAFLKIVLNTLSDPVFAKDEQHNWIIVNDACCEFLGRDREDLLGKTDFDIFPSAEAMQFWQSDDRLLTTGEMVVEEEVLSDAQGQAHIVSTQKSLAYDAAGLPIIVGTIQDITSHKQAEAALKQQAERERLLGAIAQHILQSPKFENLAQVMVREARQFLKADRVLLYSFDPLKTGILSIATDSQLSLPPALDSYLAALPDQMPALRRGQAVIVDGEQPLPLERWPALRPPIVQTTLLIPVLRGENFWGILLAQQERFDRQWLPWEIDTLRELGVQVGSAIQQNKLYQQVQQLNTALEAEVQQRTTQLQTALDFEATLKRITDRVRDNLDEKQILQTAVRELTLGLGVKGSNTALYDLDQGTSTIYYEYTASLSPSQGRVSQMEAFPEVYHQLLEGQYFQFCSVVPHPLRGHVAMLACPILDDRGVLGDLWLINDKDYGFKELDIRLVQQVANQCAIAIRQARLYQAAQSQVEELERLNNLKDDFLSTVSHELRTPVTSMRVALQLLGVTLRQEHDLEAELEKPKAEQHRIVRYYQILQEECEREISLINDLLDLQRLDGGNHPIHPTELVLREWLASIVNGFYARAKNRDQDISIVLSPDVSSLTSDSASLERVIAELLNNACKYTPPGGQITLEVLPQANDRIRFNIRNTGVEIPESELPRIFDKFYRVPSADPWKQGGTGLGLALVQRLLVHLKSEIQVSSGDDQTCFSFDLPDKLTITE